MSERDWQRLAQQHKRELDSLFERQCENIQDLFREHRNVATEEQSLIWDPFVAHEYRILGSPPESTYSSRQMDKIRKLQELLHQRYITKKWKDLWRNYSQTEDGVKAIQRWKTIQSFVASERTLCTVLRHLNNNYAVPLIQQEAGGSVSIKDLQGIFSNLYSLTKHNHKFLQAIEIQFNRYPLKPLEFGKLYCIWATHIKEYEKYTDRYTNAITLLAQLQKMRQFNDWIENVAPLPGTNRSNAPSFAELLIYPVRRITQYSAFFSNMLKYTDNKHAEYEDIQKAATLAEEISGQTEVIVAQAEGVLQVYDIQTKFCGSFPNLVKPYRTFLRYDALQEVGEHTQERFVALFNDCIVIASMDESSSAIGSYRFMRMISLTKASVKPIPDLPPTFVNAFMLGTSSGVVSFSCRTKQVKDSWLEDLEKVIDNLESSFFSSETTEVDERQKDGFLMVNEKGTLPWANRWCIFENGSLDICNSYQGQTETSIIVKQCRLNLLPDKETGKSYCFELNDSFTQKTMRFSVADRDSFDEWINLLVPISNQDIPDASDEDIAQLNSIVRARSTSNQTSSFDEEQDNAPFLPPKID